MQPLHPDTGTSELAATQAALQRLAASIAVASGLATAGRRVDLAGLDKAAGVLCAKVLDLSPADAALLKPSLAAMTENITSLMATLQTRPGS